MASQVQVKRVVRVQVEEWEVVEAMEQGGGLCTKCRAITTWCCEPDAVDYECDECGEHKVQGMGECLIMGLLQVVKDRS